MTAFSRTTTIVKMFFFFGLMMYFIMGFIMQPFSLDELWVSLFSFKTLLFTIGMILVWRIICPLVKSFIATQNKHKKINNALLVEIIIRYGLFSIPSLFALIMFFITAHTIQYLIYIIITALLILLLPIRKESLYSST